MEEAIENIPDLVISDLMMPEMDGIAMCRKLKSDERTSHIPVIMLTARGEVSDRVQGLDSGADDYLGKPFHAEELVARIQALLRRSHDMPGPRLRVAGLELDEERQQVRLAAGEVRELTGTEFRLLRYFMLNPGRILSKTRLTEHVYEQDFDRDSNLIEVYVRRLRDKLGKDLIQTRRGQGYLFVAGKE